MDPALTLAFSPPRLHLQGANPPAPGPWLEAEGDGVAGAPPHVAELGADGGLEHQVSVKAMALLQLEGPLYEESRTVDVVVADFRNHDPKPGQ